MNTFSVSRLALTLAFGVTLTACSSTPPDQRPSDQTAPGTSSRPILSAKEAQNFDAQHYFASLTPGAAAWNPSPITLPAQPDFVVGPAGTQGVTHTTIQAAVDAAIIKRTNKRQYIAVMPGEYQGTVYVPAAPGGITLYGTGEKPIDVKIGLSLDGGMSPADWRHDVNPRGKYMPGKPAWYMYDSCQSKRSDSIGVLCSAVFWSQNNGLQLQNLTIENTLGDSVDAGNHPAVIRDSAINEGFNTAKPWADAVISNRPFAGNTGSVDDNDEIQRNLNDTNYNRMWEYNNRGVGSKVVAEAKK